MKFVLHSDKGFDECFNKNTQGNSDGNCGSNGTNFIPCQARCTLHKVAKEYCTCMIYQLSNSLHTCSDVMCGMIYCSPGEYQYVDLIYNFHNVTVEVYVSSLQQYKECR